MERLTAMLIVTVIWSLTLMAQSRGLMADEDKKAKVGDMLTTLAFFLVPIALGLLIAWAAADLPDQTMSFGVAIGIVSTGLVVQGELLRGKDPKQIGKQLRKWSWVMWYITAFTIVAIILVAVL